MRKLLSLHLDFIRALAAVCVVFYHYSNHVLGQSEDAPHRAFPSIGHESVMAFFVLSGFVIAYVISEREKTFADFMSKRLARLWSVLLPSLLVIFGCYALSQRLVPQPRILVGAPDHPLLRSLAAISFLNYNSFTMGYWLVWGGVVWSLTCEFWYYCLAAIWMFAPGNGPKWLATVVLAVFLGFKVMLLMPVWLMGVWAYHRSKTLNWSRRTSSFIMAGAALGMVLLYESGLRDSLLHFPGRMASSFQFARFAPYFWLVGALMTLYILAAHCHASEDFPVAPWIDKSIRWVANISFFLYLTHPALMLLLQCVLQHFNLEEPFPYFIPLAVLAFTLLVGRPIEDSKRYYVKGLRRLIVKTQSIFFAGKPVPAGAHHT